MVLKNIPWVKIKAEYLQGATPKQIAKKYKITAEQVSNKAARDKWTSEKNEIQQKTKEKIQDKIQKLTNLALEGLVEVINDPECKNGDKVQACKAILDISGLKSLKQEITGKDGEPIGIQKIYVTSEEVQQVKDHINSVING